MNAFPEVLPDNFAYDLGGLNVSAEETQNGAPVLFRCQTLLFSRRWSA